MADKVDAPPTAEELFASTQEQLRHGRKLTEEANRLVQAAEAQAEGVQRLSEKTGRLVEEAQSTLDRAEDLRAPSE